MDAFADNTRHIIKDFKDKERSLEDDIDYGIAHFEAYPTVLTLQSPGGLINPIIVRYV